MSYACTNPLCRWAAFNGDHPDLPHAVWWGCTRRPPAPFRKGDVVRSKHWLADETARVAVIGWDEGRGWQLTFDSNGWLTAPHDPADFELAGGHVQPDIFDLLETA